MLNEKILRNDEKAVYNLRSLYRRFGYSRFKMSKFEEYDLYVRNKDFLISQGIITFTDTNGKLLALKPDVTLSIIKNSKDQAGFVQKRQHGFVARNAMDLRIAGAERNSGIQHSI